MHFAATLVAAASLLKLSTAGYTLEDDYLSGDFFSKFDFFNGGDPTHGFVNYVDRGTAQKDGYINTDGGKVFMGVDSTSIAGAGGRNSVRLTSTKAYTHALVVLDLAHMPGGVCGAWPAL
jgi:hypothetical protein